MQAAESSLISIEPDLRLAVESFSSPALERRDRIQSFENALMGMPQVELKVTHYFADGLYAREMFIPKGTMLTGALHLFEHINVCSQGDISVYTEDAPATQSSNESTEGNFGMGRPVFYMNRTVYSMLRIQALNKSNYALSIEKGLTQFGSATSWLSFNGVPIRRVDQLLNTEARVV